MRTIGSVVVMLILLVGYFVVFLKLGVLGMIMCHIWYGCMAFAIFIIGVGGLKHANMPLRRWPLPASGTLAVFVIFGFVSLHAVLRMYSDIKSYENTMNYLKRL